MPYLPILTRARVANGPPTLGDIARMQGAEQGESHGAASSRVDYAVLLCKPSLSEFIIIFWLGRKKFRPHVFAFRPRSCLTTDTTKYL